jgi:DNA-directed RNA polymerase specialized sigma24 family protein
MSRTTGTTLTPPAPRSRRRNREIDRALKALEPQIRRYCRRHLARDQDAEDVTQEALIRI